MSAGAHNALVSILLNDQGGWFWGAQNAATQLRQTLGSLGHFVFSIY
jgi:hypothetical protein